MMSKFKSKMKLAAGMLCASLLAGCGGGGGGDNSAVIDANYQLNGTVVDGYLVGAKVCLDLNTNWVCDAGEPFATTGTGGRYKLDISPLRYWETYDKLVIAEVGPEVKDEATGKTLREQGQSGYVLAARGSVKPVLTPITTLQIAKQMSEGASYGEQIYVDAVTALLKDSGMSFSKADYFDSSESFTVTERALAQRTGRVLAAALSATQARLKSEVATVYGASSEGLGARAAGLLTIALSATRASNAAETEADQLTRINQQVLSTALNSDTEKLLRKPVSTLDAATALATIGSGFYDSSLVGSTPRSLLTLATQGDGGAFAATSLQYRSSAWARDASYQNQGAAGYHLIYSYRNLTDPNTIESAVVNTLSPVWFKDGLVLKEKFSDAVGAPVRQVQILMRDAQDLPFAAVPALSTATGNFGTGHKVYQIRRKALVDEYAFDSVASFFTSLAAFKASPRTCYAGVCWSITKSASEFDIAFEGTMKFTTTSSNGSLDLGEAKFVETTLGNVRLFVMTSIPVGVQNRSAFWSAKDGRYPVFADFDNKLWVGHYAPSGTIWTSDWLLSRTELNAALTAMSLTPVAP
jgi:hypothetical protein